MGLTVDETNANVSGQLTVYELNGISRRRLNRLSSQQLPTPAATANLQDQDVDSDSACASQSHMIRTKTLHQAYSKTSSVFSEDMLRKKAKHAFVSNIFIAQGPAIYKINYTLEKVN